MFICEGQGGLGDADWAKAGIATSDNAAPSNRVAYFKVHPRFLKWRAGPIPAHATGHRVGGSAKPVDSAVGTLVAGSQSAFDAGHGNHGLNGWRHGLDGLRCRPHGVLVVVLGLLGGVQPKPAGDLMVALRVLGGWWLPAMTNNMKPKKMKASVTQYRRLRTSLDISVDASAFWRAAKAR